MPQRLPGVLLHDHLDGGLRPATVVELADDVGYRGLPTTDPAQLAEWFDQKQSGSLETYLEAFTHTIAVMQTSDALHRVAAEAALDLAADGVVYAEVRFAPHLHTRRGLSLDEVMEAVTTGLDAGAAESGLAWGVIVDAIRSEPTSEEAVDLAIRWQKRGVVGFDLAGPERGYPPELHLPAIRRAQAFGLRVTLHAGEAAGVESLAAALRAGAERIGHGVEVVEDCRVEGGEIVQLGRVATQVRDRAIPLEVCPSSNLATKRWSPDQHPVGMLHRAGFAVTLNTDNRLMSRTRLSQEMDLVVTHHRFGVSDLALVARRALQAAFCPSPLKRELWEQRLAPAYRAAGADASPRW